MSEIGASFLRKTRSEIQNVPIVDGQLIFETDQENNSKIYTDIGTDRITIGGKTDVVDVLNSTSAVDALSANKGKELNDAIENIVDGTTVVANTVQTYTHTYNAETHVHNLIGSGNNGKFEVEYAFTTGDTWAVNGNAVTAYQGADVFDGELRVGGVMPFYINGDELNFSGASGLKLKVVGGTEQPSNPSENMIWVKTSVALSGNYQIGGTTLPTTASNGDVYFVNDANNGTIVPYTVGKTTLNLGVSFVAVWTDDDWKRCPVSVRNGSSWVEVGVTLINGQFISPLYGDLKYHFGAGAPGFIDPIHGLALRAPYEEENHGYFDEKINLSAYSKINFITDYQEETNASLRLFITDNISSLGSVVTTILDRSTPMGQTRKTTVDITAESSEKYIYVQKYKGDKYGGTPCVVSMTLY